MTNELSLNKEPTSSIYGEPDGSVWDRLIGSHTMSSLRRSDCPISCTLDLVGDKWTLLILRDILFFNKKMFYEFLDAPEGISTNILTDRLHKMEEAGLIEKEPYSNHRYRFAYKATEAAHDLIPIMKSIGKWGLSHIENTKTGAEMLEIHQRNKEAKAAKEKER